MFDFGLRLQELRMSRNLSQSALGKKLNRSKSVICAYENNLRIPPLGGANRYCCVLQCFTRLFGWHRQKRDGIG